MSTASPLRLLAAEHRDLDTYRSAGGYRGLERAGRLSAEELLATVERSSLRGRGGAGFFTAPERRVAARQPAAPRPRLANCYDAEPAPPVPRPLPPRSPPPVLQGALIPAL